MEVGLLCVYMMDGFWLKFSGCGSSDLQVLKIFDRGMLRVEGWWWCRMSVLCF